MKKIGIVFATMDEYLPVSGVFGKCEKKENIGTFKVFSYYFKEKKIIAIISNVGEIRAAAATQLLITKFGVECILNFGLCGGLTSKQKGKDVVLVDGVIHTDFDTTINDGFVPGQVIGFDRPIIKTDRELLKKAKKISAFSEVICASADKFVNTKEARIALNKEFGADICEMEAAGILITAKSNGIPSLHVKAVSDTIEGEGAEFLVLLEQASRAYCKFIEQIIEVL